MIEVTPELLARHDQPGPRYTSYPTALEFSDAFGPDDYAGALAGAAGQAERALSLYVHLPFCEARCSFCACHVVLTRNPNLSDAYLERLVEEARLLMSHLGDRRRLVQYHWGGGTPTYHPPEVLAGLHRRLLEAFELAPDAEVAIEVDPRVTTVEHLEMLAEAGFNRVSLGVQDLDPGVQELIGRHQTEDQTVSLYESARKLGFDSINLDLIYGLPGQETDTLERTLDRVLEMRPDRLAVYSFAYVPWIRPHQKRMDPSLLPDTSSKFALLALAVTALTGAGYRQIGMDHFALPDDELAQAADSGSLNRNFMGYTPKRDTEIIALGTSGISDISSVYAQDHRRLASYLQSVADGVLPIERGYQLTGEDRLRRDVITELMCNGSVDLDAVAAEHGWPDSETFTGEIEELESNGGLVDEGMAIVEGQTIRATELGMLFVRRLAKVFDTHTARRDDDRPAFSRTV